MISMKRIKTSSLKMFFILAVGMSAHFIYSAIGDSETEAGYPSCNDECQRAKLNQEIQQLSKIQDSIIQQKIAASQKEILKKIQEGKLALSKAVLFKDDQPLCYTDVDENTAPEGLGAPFKGFESSVSLDLLACGKKEEDQLAEISQGLIVEGTQTAAIQWPFIFMGSCILSLVERAIMDIAPPIGPALGAVFGTAGGGWNPESNKYIQQRLRIKLKSIGYPHHNRKDSIRHIKNAKKMTALTGAASGAVTGIAGYLICSKGISYIVE